MTRKALIVGINYPGTSYPLKGCVNDANLIADMLTEHFGFTDAGNRRMLTDASATTEAMLERLEWLVADAKSGDVLWFSYSGHGSQLINQKYDVNDYEPDNKDEIIAPVDLNWRDKVIRDDKLKEIFDKVPAGVNLTVLLDCCNSGSGLDQTDQYQSLGLGEARSIEITKTPGARFIEMPDDIANRGRGLDLDVRSRSVQSRNVNKTGMLITGCQAQQTSADAWIDRKFVGAATYYLVDTLKNNNYDITYKGLIDEMNQAMVKNNYSQRPQLDGSPDLHESKFLEPLRIGTGLEEPTTVAIPPAVEVVITPTETIPKPPSQKPEKDKKKNNLVKKIVGAAVAVGIILAIIFLQ